MARIARMMIWKLYHIRRGEGVVSMGIFIGSGIGRHVLFEHNIVCILSHVAYQRLSLSEEGGTLTWRSSDMMSFAAEKIFRTRMIISEHERQPEMCMC